MDIYLTTACAGSSPVVALGEDKTCLRVALLANCCAGSVLVTSRGITQNVYGRGYEGRYAADTNHGELFFRLI